MTLSDETLDAIDDYIRSMQLSAWRGKPYADYQRAFDAGVEKLAAAAASEDEANEVRMNLRERTEYEGSDQLVDENGIIVWEDRPG